ncbi:unknown protein [Desulfotalea psychrophila LSv54]|uniref:Uncharacterized protein n=2 Tax=Desulfotalea psychrophila TaxID=84980 RepID=Q6ASE3_DESPS|nr:unknown protein [Desulfotalea psychrophila LSv54]
MERSGMARTRKNKDKLTTEEEEYTEKNSLIKKQKTLKIKQLGKEKCSPPSVAHPKPSVFFSQWLTLFVFKQLAVHQKTSVFSVVM